MEGENNNEEIIRQLQETNSRLRSMQNVLIGVLISTAALAIFFIMLYSKVSKFLTMDMEDF